MRFILLSSRCLFFLAFSCVGFLISDWRCECKADLIFVENFQDDVDPTFPGFDSSIFLHNIVGPNSFIDVPQNVVPPSPDHAFFMGASTTDMITFNLMAGQSVDSASIWMTGTGGGAAGVTFLGTNGSLGFTTVIQDNFQQFSVGPADNLGEITGILLGLPLPPDPPGPGQEAYYDDITIHVIPEPSAVLGLASLILLALQHRRREKIR